MFWNKPLIVTHSGKFHADEVFACAALSILHGGRVRVKRTRKPEEFSTGDYVVDVGLEYDPSRDRFDHHQEGGAGVRENGIPYSSFGLVWKEYGAEVCGSKEIAEDIERRLVIPIDANDNGIELAGSNEYGTQPYSISDAVKNAFRYPPGGIKNYNYDPGFFSAFDVACTILGGEIRRGREEEAAKQVVDEAYESAEDKRILILKEKAPWGKWARMYPEVLFVITPPNFSDGSPASRHWYVKTVTASEDSFERRKDFPAAWAGKEEEELQEVSGVSDAVFCHNRQFIAAARSREGAYQLALRALTQ